MSQALKQVRDQAKAMGTHISSHVLPGNSPSARPGLTTRQTGSPQLTPRAEREQLVVPPLDPSGTATAASAAPQAGPPQATRKSQSKAADDRSLGHGPLPQPQPQPQPQGQPQAQSQAQPQAQPSAHPPLQLPPPPPSLSRGQQAQPQASAPATRNSTEYSAPRSSRPHDERSAGHEKDHHQREGELLQHEVDAIDAYFYQQKTQLDKRQAVIDATRAHVRQREDNIATLEEKVRYYESEPYRQEVLSIRKHMQVNDVQEVSAITEKFRRITRKVEDISRDLGEKLSDSQAIREPTTKDLLTILLRRSATKQPGNVSVVNLPMDPEDFIDFGCRALLNDWLVERICGVNLFHPALAGRPENDLFLNTYGYIRRQEPQTIAGRWRVSTFNALKSHVCDPHAIAQEFCQNALVTLCGHVYKPEVYAEPVEVASGAIKELFKNTLDWTYLSKSSVVMLDFQPGFFSPGSPFDQQYAQLEGPGKHQPGPEGILLTSKLGLISSRAQGPHAQGIEYTLQVPAKVLASQYFS